MKFDALESTTPDETATLMLLITLRDPPEPEPTWSPDDIAALERAIRDKALELRITWPWLIHIQPETPEIEGSEEEEDEE